MAHALIHILGSRSGYTTLDATPGVSEAERAELEVLSFGDATNSDAMARLEHAAVMTGRRLRSGRFAVSRMLPGGVDDAGRPTVEIITMLLEGRAYTAVAGVLPRLAEDARYWRLARGAVAKGYELPEGRCVAAADDPGVLRAFDTWIAARKQGGIGVMPAAEANAVLAMAALLERVDQEQCRWGIGLLSLSAPVDLCTLASTASVAGPRPIVRATSHNAWISSEMDHVAWHLQNGNPLLPRTDALVVGVRIDPALDVPASSGPFARGPAKMQRAQPAPPPRDLTKVAGISAACSLALLSLVAVLYARGGHSTGSVVAVAPAEAPHASPAETSNAAAVQHGDYDQVQAEQKVAEPAQLPPSPGQSAPPSQPPESTAPPPSPNPTTPSNPPQESTPPGKAASSPPAGEEQKDGLPAGQADKGSDKQGEAPGTTKAYTVTVSPSPLANFSQQVRTLSTELSKLKPKSRDQGPTSNSGSEDRELLAETVARTWEKLESELKIVFREDRQRKETWITIGEPRTEEGRDSNGFSCNFNKSVNGKNIVRKWLCHGLLTEWQSALVDLRALVRQLRSFGDQLGTPPPNKDKDKGQGETKAEELFCLFKGWDKWTDNLESSGDELSIELKAVNKTLKALDSQDSKVPAPTKKGPK